MKIHLSMECAFVILLLVGCVNTPSLSEPSMIPGSIEGERPRNAVGKVMSRTKAKREHTLLLKYGAAAEYSANIDVDGSYVLQVRYSNDDAGKCDDIIVLVDGKLSGKFHSLNTRKEGTKAGDGWNEFAESPDIDLGTLSAGEHAISLLVDDGDAFGIEIDRLTIVQAESKGAK